MIRQKKLTHNLNIGTCHFIFVVAAKQIVISCDSVMNTGDVEALYVSTVKESGKFAKSYGSGDGRGLTERELDEVIEMMLLR